MTTLTETDLTRVSTTTAEQFVDEYYNALHNARNKIQSFYIPTQQHQTGRGLPSISYNGETINDSAILQERYVNSMPYTFFETQSVNVHVMNSCIVPGEVKSKRDAERNISLVVQVSGFVRLVERKDGQMRGFADSFVLVPNKEDAGGKGTGKQDFGRRWLIQSQNFRFVT